MDHTEHMKASKNTSLANPCLDRLSDMEYLEHMIPHHQVAIDMSHMLEPSTSSDVMLNLCRNIIRNQKLEIWEMKRMKQYPVASGLFSDDEWLRENIITKLDTYNPRLSRAKEGPCNPLFFKPNDHSKHMEGMVISDKSYLEHMIPHHQVAVDMSKRLLLHTNNSYLLEFCRQLIIDQQGEILYMNNILMGLDSLYHSELLGSK
jgi:uncharacterized protein (DUF305 family)|tara:strand:+ start:395 stop:1006 length:612 start_codon:yes stop_codon:yes gene_type:complete